MSQYLDWAAARRRGGGAFPEVFEASKSAFFSDPDCGRMYKANAKALIERVNAFTGVSYRDDPTIFAWELINEPRCRGCGARLQAWIEEMAKYVKRLDPNHMLSTGEEGFYAGDARGSARVNPEVWASTTGQDFIANHAVPEIDFAVAHLWPDNWGVFTLGGSLGAAFTEEWIRAHTRDATRVLRKPFVLEEFGVKGGQSGFAPGRDAAETQKEIFVSFVLSTGRVSSLNAKTPPDSPPPPPPPSSRRIIATCSRWWSARTTPTARSGARCSGRGTTTTCRRAAPTSTRCSPATAPSGDGGVRRRAAGETNEPARKGNLACFVRGRDDGNAVYASGTSSGP